jgi:hypothetical protein
MAESGHVRVVCRVRPQLGNELGKGGTSICHFDKTGKSVVVDVCGKSTL